ncbi:hypothetical protein OG912_00075 [Streptomyces sp. NBC_00464]|uniref:hypothetical protein n=1 Tax=Streptomyces sp. NBC_00464 TaxID=2975751 RepID=UPI002E17D979
MEETVQHVEEMLDASPVIDVDTFAQFQQLLTDLKAKIDARFTTTRDPSTDILEQYGTYPEGPGGRVAAYNRAGGPLDGALVAGRPVAQLRQPA